MSILDKLFGLKRSDELAGALPQLQAEIAAVEQRLSGMKTSLRSAPFESSSDEVTKLRRKVRDTEDELETLRGVYEEAKRRQQAAAAAELEQTVRTTMAQARNERRRLLATYAEFDRHLEALRDCQERAASALVELVRTNAAAAAAGLPQLQIRLPNPNHFEPFEDRLAALSACSMTVALTGCEAKDP